MKKIEGLMLLQREPFAFSKTQKVKYEALKFIYSKILHWLRLRAAHRPISCVWVPYACTQFLSRAERNFQWQFYFMKCH